MLVARSAEECHLYMELHGCSCGADEFTWTTHSAALVDGRRLSTYEGTCDGCGTPRSFTFAIEGDPPPPPAYGGDTPSLIIDPGEFLASSRQAATGVPPLPEQVAEDDLDAAYDAIELAVAGVVEVLKFVPPGADAVPAEAFTSDLGRQMYEIEPDQFARDRLNLELAHYERIRAAHAVALGEA